MKFHFPRQLLEKYSNMNFHENPSSGRGINPCGRSDRRTDRYDEVKKSLFPILRKPLRRGTSVEVNHVSYHPLFC